MQRNLVPIGRFSRLCRLTIPALRHYDDVGLLRPAAIDPDTGYRYYSLAQAEEAEWIRILRFMDMPIEEISALLAERDPEARADRLDQHRRRLQGRIEGYQASLAFLRRLMSQEAGPMQYEVHVRETADQPVATVRDRTPVSGFPAFFQGAYGEILGLIGAAGIQPAGPPFSIYHDPEFTDDDVDVEVGFPVARAVASAGRVVGRVLPGGPVAETLHVGPYDEVGPAYRAVAGWVQEHGHEMAGPPREVYLVGVGMAEPAEYRTEIVFPIG